ncbi:GNAT family N-acetyltransferase [Methylophaga frappieri]|uniref:GNAT family N-acetyltransferase n=1 Tax=Methylophaga frappieri (strain ATCC BAA-2434 / DSM 25690 / JAM7) TaxID=754477 RepID=UPI00059E86A1|nr:GNAT family N-acetyltransferase [Methylophaga frappieri]
MLITEVSEPSEEDFEVLKNGLNGFNEVHSGPLLNEKVSSFVKNDKNETVGGILGEINWGWLHIKGLWVSESVRSKGLGAGLLSKLETYAKSKGITNIRLETTSFQALGFYEKQGYVLFGQLPDMPPTYTSYFLMKQTRI